MVSKEVEFISACLINDFYADKCIQEIGYYAKILNINPALWQAPTSFSWYAFAADAYEVRWTQIISEKFVFFESLGWKDSNLRMAVPKTAALPLGDTPLWKAVRFIKDKILLIICFFCKLKIILALKILFFCNLGIKSL